MAKNEDMTKRTRQEFTTFVKSFIFGVEDSLVSTVGLLSGIAVAGLSKKDIFLAGIVLIFVEAFSMGVGSYLSEQSAEQFIKTKRSISIPAGIIMFFSYFFAGFIPLAPYLLFEVNTAFPTSIILSLISLFILGVSSALVYKTSVVKQGLRMLLVGGMAIGMGVLVGSFVHNNF